jgi:hypothetical protein
MAEPPGKRLQAGGDDGVEQGQMNSDKRKTIQSDAADEARAEKRRALELDGSLGGFLCDPSRAV